ncbi:MAG: transcriptional regulator [Candidatus Aenigmatarchaeota archaeon]
MKLSCESFVKDVLPAVRAMVARDLLERHDMTQRQVALKLDMTQPAISQYKNKLRGAKARKIKSSKEVTDKISEFAEDIVKERIDKDDYSERFCEICLAAKEASILPEEACEHS